MGIDFVLRPDQIEDLGALIRNPRHGLWSEPGTGKTPVACLYTWWVWDRLKKHTVWLQPLAIIEKNREELLLWTDFKEHEVVIVEGTPAQRARLYADPNIKVFLMGADTFGREWEQILAHHPVGLVVGDEWHKMFSTNDSKRTQALYQAMKHIDRLTPMTGTLVRGRLNSAFPAIHLIQPRYYGHHRTFMNRHAIQDEYGKVIGWVKIDIVQEILRAHGQNRLYSEVYGDIPVVFQTHYCKMSTAQSKAYKEFEEKAILELEGAFLDGSLPGVNLIRARQILSSPEIFGLCKGEMTGRDALLDIQMTDHLEMGTPWMIGSASVPEQERVAAYLEKNGMRVGLMNGETPRKERGAIDLAFRKRELDTVVVSPEVGSIGFNWGHCDHVSFLHLPYYHDDFDQFWKRCTRGQIRTTPVRVDTLVYEDTVEEGVVGIIVGKMVLSKEVDPTRQVVNLHARKPIFRGIEERVLKTMEASL